MIEMGIGSCERRYLQCPSLLGAILLLSFEDTLHVALEQGSRAFDFFFASEARGRGGSVVTGWGTVNDRKHAVKN